jgi:hypothetical protein
MTTITFPLTTDTIDAMRLAIGRNATFYIPASSAACPICLLDPITNTSTNSFCNICEGNYWITTFSGVNILAHITWGGVDQMGWAPGGQYFEGDCRVQIKYTTYNDGIVDSAVRVVVDDKEMKIKNKIYRGFKEINRILLDLTEEEA